MNVTESLKRLRRTGPESNNGTSTVPKKLAATAPMGGTRSIVLIVVPLLALGVAAGLQQYRRVSTPAPVERTRGVMERTRGAMGKATAKRRKPRSLVRYYGMGVLINALERDATRKMIIATLKLMQKRA